jgi:transcription termination factor Rho
MLRITVRDEGPQSKEHRMTDFESKSLAELHKLAADAKIEGFRLMRKDDLVDKLSSDDTGGDEGGSGGSSGGRDGEQGGGSSRPRRRRGRGGRDRSRRDDSDRKGSDRGDRAARDDEGGGKHEGDDLTEATGVLEVQPRGSGLVHGEGLPDAGVYVSPAQIRRCELRSGDEVSGPVRPARRGERRPSMVRIETVNGEPPQDERGPAFEGLTAIAPHRHIPLKVEGDDVLARSVDLLTPLAFGQRVLVEAQPRSGRTSVLRALAKSIAAGSEEGPEVTVLLVDERPEEITAWTREVPGVSIEAAPADLDAQEQVRIAERALATVRRQAEAGQDVVLIVDSLTRLGTACGDAGSIKPFFGTGRELEEDGAGSVTVIATVLSGSPGDESVLDAVRTTENSTIRLDGSLAEAGIAPALDVVSCVTSGQESVLSESEVDAVRRLRAELTGMDATAAAARLAELIKGSDNNLELLEKL